MEETIKDIIKDYLYYGYSLNFLLNQNYPVVKEYGEEKTKELWHKTVEEMQTL